MSINSRVSLVSLVPLVSLDSDGFFLLDRPRVFFDIQIGKQKAGRVAFELVCLAYWLNAIALDRLTDLFSSFQFNDGRNHPRSTSHSNAQC